MKNPTYSKAPSESTIEQLSNHHLLNELGPCDSWFFIPTKVEEKKLGYDASLQGYKALIIQYKAFTPNVSSGAGRISINQTQHKTLLKNFPKKSKPYAFYGFSTAPSYKHIANYYSTGTGCCSFGNTMIYIDIHDIPIGTTSINSSSLSCKSYNLFELSSLFLKCKLGLRNEAMKESVESNYFDAEAEGEEGSSLSILWANVPNIT